MPEDENLQDDELPSGSDEELNELESDAEAKSEAMVESFTDRVKNPKKGRPKKKNMDRLSFAEFQVIRKLTLDEGWTDEKIAEKLGRNIKSIRAARIKMGLSKSAAGTISPETKLKTEKKKVSALRTLSDDEKLNSWAKLLKRSSRYDRLVSILTDGELTFFVEQWAKLHVQFEDLSFTEEDTLEELIQYQIRLQDNTRQRKEVMDNEAQLRSELAGRSLKELDLENEDERFLFEMIQSNNRVKTDLNKDFRELTDRYQSLLESLNATRKQREDKSRIGGDTFLSLVKQFNDADYRREVGRQEELLRLATNKQLEKLKQNHRFMDGNEEPIILDGADFVKEKTNVKDTDSGGN